jgi:RND family efflux transporter MFP subunit
MSDALPPGPERPLLDESDEDKLRREVESLRVQLEEERKRNRPPEDKHKNTPRRPGGRTLRLLGLAILVILAIAFFIGFLPRYRRGKQLQNEARTQSNALPIVTYFVAQRSAGESQLILPGSIEALTDSPVLARSDGYLKKRYVDIGDSVKAGQLLAEVASPDVDQQVQQARAQLSQAGAALKQSMASLEQARANLGLAKLNAERWGTLVKKGAVSREENDMHQADYQAQTANVAALEEAASAGEQNVRAVRANMDRLLELQGFEMVRAPFAGTITLRNIDVGALITNSQTLLFRIAQIQTLRTFLNVPESGAATIQAGQSATLTVQEYPGRQFNGRITRTSKSLDPATRTMLTEVQVPNAGSTLLPGMFAEVTLNQPRPNPPILIPADSMMVRSDGTFVGILEQENDREEKVPTFKVHLRRISIGRDYGNAIEVLTGLNNGERVVENPNDHVQENARVKGEKTKQNPVTSSGASAGKQNANNEKLNPQPGAEPTPKKPDKENLNRGPAN